METTYVIFISCFRLTSKRSSEQLMKIAYPNKALLQQQPNLFLTRWD